MPGRRACCRAESRLKAPTCAVPRERPGPGGFQQRPPLWPPRAPSALGRRAFGALCRRRARSAGFFPHTAFVQRCWAAGRNRVPHSSPRGGGVTAWSASLLCRPNTRTAPPRCCVLLRTGRTGADCAGSYRSALTSVPLPPWWKAVPSLGTQLVDEPTKAGASKGRHCSSPRLTVGSSSAAGPPAEPENSGSALPAFGQQSVSATGGGPPAWASLGICSGTERVPC